MDAFDIVHYIEEHKQATYMDKYGTPYTFTGDGILYRGINIYLDSIYAEDWDELAIVYEGTEVAYIDCKGWTLVK